MNLSLSTSDKLTFISNFATMLSAGIPILEAVDSLTEETKGNQRKVLLILKEGLSEGKTISNSLASTNAFDPVMVNLIKAAEEAGTLETTLKDLTVSVKKDIEFNDRVKASLIYPILVVVVFLLVMVVILTFVIPRIATVFSKLKIVLPLPTQILIFVSNFLLSYYILFIIGVIILAIGLVFLYKTHKKRLLNVFFSLPFLSGLAQEIDLARFTRALSLLLGSGIPITEALELCHNITTKHQVADAIIRSQNAVVSGKKLSEGLKESRKVISGITIRMVEAGEKSGTLEKSMQELCDYYETKVTNTLKTFTTLLEPMLLVIVGFIVGGIMLAIVAPIYGLISQITSR